jgi:hypothetical protein
MASALVPPIPGTAASSALDAVLRFSTVANVVASLAAIVIDCGCFGLCLTIFASAGTTDDVGVMATP